MYRVVWTTDVVNAKTGRFFLSYVQYQVENVCANTIFLNASINQQAQKTISGCTFQSIYSCPQIVYLSPMMVKYDLHTTYLFLQSFNVHDGRLVSSFSRDFQRHSRELSQWRKFVENSRKFPRKIPGKLKTKNFEIVSISIERVAF